MIKPLMLSSAALLMLAVAPAFGVDGKGLTDGSVYDHTGVSPYEQPKRHAPPQVRSRDDDRYPLRCYWTVKTTDGWWPTGATQVCTPDRRN